MLCKDTGQGKPGQPVRHRRRRQREALMGTFGAAHRQDPVEAEAPHRPRPSRLWLGPRTQVRKQAAASRDPGTQPLPEKQLSGRGVPAAGITGLAAARSPRPVPCSSRPEDCGDRNTACQLNKRSVRWHHTSSPVQALRRQLIISTGSTL